MANLARSEAIPRSLLSSSAAWRRRAFPPQHRVAGVRMRSPHCSESRAPSDSEATTCVMDCAAPAGGAGRSGGGTLAAMEGSLAPPAKRSSLAGAARTGPPARRSARRGAALSRSVRTASNMSLRIVCSSCGPGRNWRKRTARRKATSSLTSWFCCAWRLLPGPAVAASGERLGKTFGNRFACAYDATFSAPEALSSS